MSMTLTVMAKDVKKKNDHIELKYGLGAFVLTLLFLIFWAQLFKCQLALTRLQFNMSCFFLLSKTVSQIIFSILFRVANHQIVGKEN